MSREEIKKLIERDLSDTDFGGGIVPSVLEPFRLLLQRTDGLSTSEGLDGLYDLGESLAFLVVEADEILDRIKEQVSEEEFRIARAFAGLFQRKMGNIAARVGTLREHIEEEVKNADEFFGFRE